jgi:hypothetical protein
MIVGVARGVQMRGEWAVSLGLYAQAGHRGESLQNRGRKCATCLCDACEQCNAARPLIGSILGAVETLGK